MTLGVSGWRIHGMRTGVGRYLLNVVRHWTSPAPFDRITFYAPGTVDRSEIPLPVGVAVERLRPHWRMLLWENARLGPFVDDDVLFCPSHSRPLLTRSRTVVVMHDMNSVLHPEMFPRSNTLFYNRLYEWSVRHATLVITDSEAGRQDILRCWNVPAEKIRVVYLGAEECFHPVAEVPAPAQPFFLFVGKMSGRRNLPCLLEAFALLKKQTSLPHELALVGLNPHRIDLERIAGRLGIARHVRICGFISDEELNFLYNRAEALVMPSVYETVSLPVMEAQAAGAPVVCIDTEGMREITGGAACLMPRLEPRALLEGMLRVAEDRAFRDTIAARGLEHSKQFSWRRCARETLDVLAEAARRHPRGAF